MLSTRLFHPASPTVLDPGNALNGALGWLMIAAAARCPGSRAASPEKSLSEGKGTMAKKVYEVPALFKAGQFAKDTGFLKRGPHEPKVRLPLGW